MSGDLHFLVVDDDNESRETVIAYLKALGYARVTGARDGGEAARLIDRDSTINFVISDWDMPMVNGLALLQRLKSSPTKAHLPFVIMTSPISAESEKIVLAAESLVDAYLIKPFRSHLLQEKIEKVLATPVRGPQKTALVVDDDPDAREMVIEYLKQLGFKDVVGLADGKQAMLFLAEKQQDVGMIISDWEMPEATGLDLLKACKLNESLKEIPFLMITSQSSIERMKVMQAARAQVDEYLLKPFTGSDLKKRIEILFERSRAKGKVEAKLAEAAEHVEHGRFARAQAVYEEAVKLDATNDQALRGLGDALIKLKGPESALPFYKRAVDSNPVNPTGYVRLAAAYELIGMFDKAVSLLQTAIQNIAFDAELHFHLGRLYNKKGYTGFAKTEFEKALEIKLDHQEARLMLEMIGHGSGNAAAGGKKDPTE